MQTAFPFLALMSNALIWGAIWWPLRQLQAQGVHPVAATALVYLLLFAGMLVRRRRAAGIARQHPMLALLALASGLTNVLFNWAITAGDVVRVVLLFYLMPAWSVLLAWRFLGGRPNRYAAVCLVLAFSGVLLVLPPKTSWASLTSHLSLADALSLAGGFAFACSNVVLRSQHLMPGQARMLAMFCGGMVAAGAMALAGMHAGVLPALPALDPAHWRWPLMVLGIAALMGVGNWTLQYAASRLAATTTAVVMLSEMVFASASTVLINGEVLCGRLLLGGALMLPASLIAALKPGLA